MSQKPPPRKWRIPIGGDKSLYLWLGLISVGLALLVTWFEDSIPAGRSLLILAIPFALAALIWLYRRDPR